MNAQYIAAVINSTIRMMTPVLFAALGSTLCSRVRVFNMALEGQMLAGSFAAFLVNAFTHNLILATLAGALAGVLVAFVVSFFQVKLGASDMVVGTSVNLLVSSLTTFLLFVVFHTKGAYQDSSLGGLPKINFSLIKEVPFLGRMLENLTILDYFSFVMAVLLYFFLFRTVGGFRLLSVGINKKAVISQGINADRIQMMAVMASGALCGLGGTLLSLGQVKVYVENITSGRGFFAMAAANVGRSHPIGVVISSFFFGFADAIGNTLQGSGIRSQLTSALPYVATVVALVFFSGNLGKKSRRKKIKPIKIEAINE